MRPRYLFITACAAALVLSGRPARAGVPVAANCTVPAHINLVAERSGTPDPIGTFTIVVRDGVPSPVSFALVTVDFSGCPDIFPAAIQYNGATVDCLNKRVTATADANGVVQFDITGAALNRLGPGAVPCASVTANSVTIGSMLVGTFDQDGVDGLDPADLSLWLHDFALGTYYQRSDYDGTGGIAAVDLSIWVCDYFSGNGAQSTPKCNGSSPTAPKINAGLVNLAWNDCAGGGGATTRTFACNTNTGVSTLVGSIVAPAGATPVSAFDATVDFVSTAPGGVPDWWGFSSGAGACNTGPIKSCRSGSLNVSGDFTGGPFGCADPWAGQVTTGIIPDYSVGGVQYGRFRIVGGANLGPVSLTAGTEYSLFKVSINNAKTVGTGSCAGCSYTTCLFLSRVELYHTDGTGSLIDIYNATSPGVSATAFWQGGLAACATPTRNVTWGQVKSLYR